MTAKHPGNHTLHGYMYRYREKNQAHKDIKCLYSWVHCEHIQDDRLEWHLHNRFLQEHEPPSCQSAAAVCETTTYPANKIAQTRRPRQISMTFQRKCVVFLACSIDILLSINSHALFGKYSGIPDRSLINILAAWQQQETSAAKCVEETVFLFFKLGNWNDDRLPVSCFSEKGRREGSYSDIFWYSRNTCHLPKECQK